MLSPNTGVQPQIFQLLSSHASTRGLGRGSRPTASEAAGESPSRTWMCHGQKSALPTCNPQSRIRKKTMKKNHQESGNPFSHQEAGAARSAVSAGTEHGSWFLWLLFHPLSPAGSHPSLMLPLNPFLIHPEIPSAHPEMLQELFHLPAVTAKI